MPFPFLYCTVLVCLQGREGGRVQGQPDKITLVVDDTRYRSCDSDHDPDPPNFKVVNLLHHSQFLLYKKCSIINVNLEYYEKNIGDFGHIKVGYGSAGNKTSPLKNVLIK